MGKTLADLDDFPVPEEGPEYYVDFDETGPYEAVIGDSECANLRSPANSIWTGKSECAT